MANITIRVSLYLLLFFSFRVALSQNLIPGQNIATVPKDFLSEKFDSIIIYDVYESLMGITMNDKINKKVIKERAKLSVLQKDSLYSILSSKTNFILTDFDKPVNNALGLLFYKGSNISAVIDISFEDKFMRLLYRGSETIHGKKSTKTFQGSTKVSLNKSGTDQLKKFSASVFK